MYKRKRMRGWGTLRDRPDLDREQTPPHWVEPDRAVLDHSKIISYGVWRFNANGGRECIKRFSVNRIGGLASALYLANHMRDDLNSKSEDAALA